MADTARCEALQVFMRVRPPIMKEVREQYAVQVRGTQAVTLTDEKRETTCTYDYVFSEVSPQSHVFDKVKPLLEDVLSGVNACIFAYGQTSAGKSYTMLGPNGGQDIFRQRPEDWGILPRASEYLLGYLNEKANEGVLSYEVKASFLQIYNENLYDLLRDTGPMIDDRLVQTDKDRDAELKIREIPRRKTRGQPVATNEVFVAGLSEFRVQTSEDILRILAVGANNRMTRSTDFNMTSSRSHALLQLTFEIEAHTETGQTVINKSKLNLVDLAGSEKIPFVTSDYNNARHMKELTSINKSLSSLGNVIAALSSNNRSHIPYRDSKLTRILQDSLSGNTRTILIACVAPTILHASESLSTLQFADRAKNVMLSVKPNTLVDDKALLTKAHEEITRLKALLAHALKQLEQRAREGGGADPQELLRLQEENDALRRDNAALKKTIKAQPGGGGGFSQHPSSLQGSIGTGASDQHLQHHHQQQQPQPGMGYQSQAQSQSSSALPFLNYSATNPSQAAAGAMGGPMYSMGNMSVDSLLGNKGPKNNGFDLQRFSLDQGKPKKQTKARNVPPLFDLLDSGRGGAKAGKSAPKKMDVPNVGKVYSKAYKSINDKQIEELNSMLSAASAQSNLQQQQNMMQYIQQQQFLQQNFPPQQLGLPYLSQPQNGASNSTAAPQMSQRMASVNTMAAALLPQFQTNQSLYSLNGNAQPGLNGLGMGVNAQNSAMQNQPYRPAPVHFGPPFQNLQSGGIHGSGAPSVNVPHFGTTPALPHISSVSPTPAYTPHSTGADLAQHHGHSNGHGPGGGFTHLPQIFDNGRTHHHEEDHQEESVDEAKEAAPSPKRSHRKKHKDRDRERSEPSLDPVARSRSDDSVEGGYTAANAYSSNNNHNHNSSSNSLAPATGRSTMSSSHGAPGDSGRVGTSQSSMESPAVKQPANRIVRKGTGSSTGTGTGNKMVATDVDSDDESEHERAVKQQKGRQGSLGGSVSESSSNVNLRSKPGSSHSTTGGGGHAGNGSSGGPTNPVTTQHAFLANIMNKQAQSGTPSGLIQATSIVEPAIQRAVNLSFTGDDVGRAVQLFSFRMNAWDRIQIVDFDSVRRQHKVRHSDGAEQWLDLAKKPIRAVG